MDVLRRRQLVRLVSLDKVQPVLASLIYVCDYGPIRLNALLELAILYLNYRIYSNTMTDLTTKEISILGIFITFANTVTDDLYQKTTRKLKL